MNEYLHSVTGQDFTAKDFRTWGGTVVAARTLRELGGYDSETQAKHNIVQAVKAAAVQLATLQPSVASATSTHRSLTHT